MHPRELFKAAILGKAAAIILCHNHPSGDPEPSRDDRELTRRAYYVAMAARGWVVPSSEQQVLLAEKRLEQEPGWAATIIRSTGDFGRDE